MAKLFKILNSYLFYLYDGLKVVSSILDHIEINKELFGKNTFFQSRRNYQK